MPKIMTKTPTYCSLGVDGLGAEASQLQPGRLYAVVCGDRALSVRLLLGNLMEGSRNTPLLCVTRLSSEEVPDDNLLSERLHARSLMLFKPSGSRLGAAHVDSARRRLLDDLAYWADQCVGIGHPAVIAVHQADAFLHAVDKARLSAELEVFRSWARKRGHILLLWLEQAAQDAAAAAALVQAADSLAGVAWVEERQDGLCWRVEHWASSSGRIANRLFGLQVPNIGLPSVIQMGQLGGSALTATNDNGEVFSTGLVLPAGVSPPLRWQLFDSLDSLCRHASVARCATLVLHFDHSMDVKELTDRIAALRLECGPQIKIVVREMGRSMRGSEERQLLACGANLVVPVEVSYPRFLGMVHAFQSSVCSKPPQVNQDLSGGLGGSLEQDRGYLAASVFVDVVDQSLVRSQALGVQSMLVRLMPMAGVDLVDVLWLCQLNRAGDFCSTDGQFLYIFLFACWETDVHSALKRVLKMPVEAVFREEIHLPTPGDIRRELKSMKVRAAKVSLPDYAARPKSVSSVGPTVATPPMPACAVAVRRPLHLRAQPGVMPLS